MKSTFTTVALSSLTASPLNVRETKPEDPAIGELASSILTKGLISPIAIHALTKPKGKFGVLAGDRRWQAIKKLQADGAAFDFETIPVNLVEGTDAELTEISLAENYVRQGMRPPEIYAAFRSIKERNPKITDDELASHYGLEPRRVARILRLAFLHPTVFDAYAAGKLKEEEAFAYAATADQELQLQTFKALSKRQDWQRRPHDIRAAMKVGDDEQRRLLGFVTLKAYEAAGGRFEANLFADKANEGRVLDEELLRRLANEKLEASRAQVIGQYGDRGEITFVDHPPTDQYGSSYDFRIREERAAPSADQEARLTELQKRDSEIEATLDDGDLYDNDGDPLPEHADRIAALEAEQETLQQEWQSIRASLPAVLPEGAKLATFTIDASGSAKAEFFWEKRPRAKAGGTAAGAAGASFVDPAKEAGLSADAVQVMRSTYRTITQALIAQDSEDGGRFAFDYLLFSQVKASLNAKVNYYSGVESWSSPARKKVGLANNLSPSRTFDKLESEIDHQPAAVYLAELRAGLLSEPCFAHHDAVLGFELFQGAAEMLRKRCIGFLASVALDRSLNLDGGNDRQNRFIDYIGNTLTQGSNSPVRELWSPDALYLGRLAKKHKLAILERIGGPELSARTKGMKAAEIGDFVGRILRCSEEDVQLLGIDEETMAAATQWLPDYLTYPSGGEIDRRAPPAPKPAETGDELDDVDDEVGQRSDADEEPELEEAAE